MIDARVQQNMTQKDLSAKTGITQADIKDTDNLPIELSEIGQWWGNDSKRKKQIQIDIVGTPVEGKGYIIGSCKYRNEKIGMDELELLRDYDSVFGKAL